MKWRSPVPACKGIKAKVFAPGRPAEQVAMTICDQAYIGRGVRVFRWPCGTLALVRVGTPSDERLLSMCAAALCATYAVGARCKPLYADVLDDVRGGA